MKNDANQLVIAYASPALVDRSYRWLVRLAVGLVVLQLIWIVPWMFWQGDVFEDGSAKKPIEDFFGFIGIAVPSIAIMALNLWYCWIHYQRGTLTQNFKLPIVLIVLAGLFIGSAIEGCVQDDIIDRNEPHGLW